MSRPVDKETRGRFLRLEEMLANANDSSLVGALISRPSTDVPAEIALLANHLARHHARDERTPLRITDAARRELTNLLARWVDMLLASSDADRQHFAEVARAIGRVASPELTAPLRQLLDQDQARWRASRDESLPTGRKRRIGFRGSGHERSPPLPDLPKSVGGINAETAVAYIAKIGKHQI